MEGKNGRVILALHGTGGNEEDLHPVARAIDRNASVLSPRGKVNENGSNRFFRRFSEGIFDLVDLSEQTDDLADFLINAASRFGFAPEDITAVGYSNGANIASSLMLRKPQVLAGAILLRGMVPFEPTAPLDLKGKRVLMINGKTDPIVPLDNAERLATILRGSGADVDLQIIDAGHNLTKEEIETAKAWYAPTQVAT